ncbi:hypothetical protein D1007_50770 [Hordeum vulgare]|nr:hypothetical protein D1007_50770 [Hordeum vulgare]
MDDACRARAERRTTRIAQTAPVGSASARRSPSPMVNAATGLKAHEQQGSSQPAIEQADGRTTTPSLVHAFGPASRAWMEMPHGRRVLAIATKLIRYRLAPGYHNDSLQHIEELVATAGDSAVLSCSLPPQLSLANDEEQEAPPPPSEWRAT